MMGLFGWPNNHSSRRPPPPPFLSVIACRNQKQKLGPIKQAHFHSLNIHPLKIQALLHAAC